MNYGQYVQYQAPPQYQIRPTPLKSRFAYIVLAILFGWLGVHNFYAGRSGSGVTQLLLSLFTCVGIFPIWIWALFEALIVRHDGLDREMKPLSPFALIFSLVLFFIVFILPGLLFLLMIIGAASMD